MKRKKIIPTTFGSVAAKLDVNGYRVIPIDARHRKRPEPKIGNWREYCFKPPDAQRYANDGVGILCGEVVGGDIDVRDQALTAEIEALAVKRLGAAPRRIGLSPKVLLLYRTDRPFKKITSAIYKLPNVEGTHKVEFLATGQQFVAYGIHCDTKQPYRWNGVGDPLTVAADALPVITEAQAREFVAEADAVLAKHGKRVNKPGLKVDFRAAREIPDGVRDDTLASIAGRLRWIELSADEINAALQQINLNRCKPPKSRDEVERIANSIARYPAGDETTAWREPINLLQDFIAPPYQAADLPDALGEWVAAYSEASGFDPSILTLSSVIGAAGMIDDRFRLCVDANLRWYESATLWGLVIAKPGAGKSPAQDAVLSPVIERHSELVKRWETESADPAENDPPPQPRLYVNDATVESISEVLRDNPRGILLRYDELESLLGSFDMYRGGGAARDRGEYLRLFQGGPNQIERIKRGTVFVPNWGASILAGTSPATLEKHAKGLPNDGLLQRFLVAVARRKTDENPSVGAYKPFARYRDTLRRMYEKGATEIAIVHMTSAARDAFREWNKGANTRQEAASSMSAGYESHVSKYAQMLLRIAHVFHFVEAADTNTLGSLDADTLQRAMRFMRTADLHAMVLYTTMLSSVGPLALARDVALAILGGEEGVVQRRQFTSGVRSFRDADDRERDRAMRLLQDYGWLRPARGGYEKGYPTRWEVNPAIGRVFAVERDRERARRSMVMEKINASAAARREARVDSDEGAKK